mmetsp:Transcript_854/g.3335  ORF Transcript_854/g.3335 Transcript_854/m.3335 type:complete len:239 (+) Transcript_854:995-1711(+)
MAEPIVARPARLELESAHGVRDVLERVHEAVREVVRRVDAPRAARVRVRPELDAIGNQVVHVEVDVARVLLHAQSGGALRHQAAAHVLEELQALFHGAVAPRRVRFRGAGRGNLVARLVAHVRLVGLDELHGERMQLIEVVRRVSHLVRLPPEPCDNLLDVVDVLLALGGRVGVVEAQVAAPAHLLGVAEVNVHGLGVADVQVAIGLGREARHDSPARALEVRLQRGLVVGVALGLSR